MSVGVADVEPPVAELDSECQLIEKPVGRNSFKLSKIIFFPRPRFSGSIAVAVFLF